MANFTVHISYDSEFRRVTALPSSLEYVKAGDTVTFSGGSFSGFSSAYWTSSANLGSSGGTKTVKSGITSGATTSITGIAGGRGTVAERTARIPISFGARDSYPDAFGISNITNADPKALILTPAITVSGINTEVGVSASSSSGGMAQVFVNRKDKPPRSYNQVKSGDKVYLRIEAAPDYMQNVTVTVTIGTRTESFTIYNRHYPLIDQLILIGTNTTPISMRNTVVDFFGSNSTSPRLTDYLRGGGLVPSIEHNLRVPTSTPIRLTDLLGSASALYFRFRPPSKFSISNTMQSAQTRTLTWDIENEYNVGYGELAKELEYRYVITRLDNLSDSISISTSTSTGYGSWSQGNRSISITASSRTSAVEKLFSGTLTVYVRNAVDTSIVISQEVSWDIIFVGP